MGDKSLCLNSGQVASRAVMEKALCVQKPGSLVVTSIKNVKWKRVLEKLHGTQKGKQEGSRA